MTRPFHAGEFRSLGADDHLTSTGRITTIVNFSGEMLKPKCVKGTEGPYPVLLDSQSEALLRQGIAA